jgi:sodium/hydrogen antiporter
VIGSRLVLEPYDLLLVAVGAALLVTTLGPGALDRWNISKSWVYLAVGLLAGPLLLDLGPDDPMDAIPVLERVAELGVIVSLVVIGARVGRPISLRGWSSTVRLILIVMPLTIGAVALTGHWLLGLALGPALLLGAVLAPTDPVMAGALEEHSLEDESEDRFGLSTEAGLNDGFAFPFVYLGLYVTTRLDEWQTWVGQWVLADLVYAVAVGLPLGWILGTLIGRLFLRLERAGMVSDKRREFLPLGLLLLAYGAVEATGGYGFLAAFTAGLAVRRAMDAEQRALARFVSFTDAVDELIKAVVLVMVGALIPWAALAADPLPVLALALVLVFVLRPVITLLATVRGGFRRIDRAYWAWFGIRGIGSIYYLSYAIGRGGIDADTAASLFAATMAVILVSALIHGVTVRPFVRRAWGVRRIED